MWSIASSSGASLETGSGADVAPGASAAAEMRAVLAGPVCVAATTAAAVPAASTAVAAMSLGLLSMAFLSAGQCSRYTTSTRANLERFKKTWAAWSRRRRGGRASRLPAIG
jgi:hypothetical protein